MKLTIIYALLSAFFGVYGTTASASNTNQVSQNLETATSSTQEKLTGSFKKQSRSQRILYMLFLILTTQQLFWISKRQRLSIN